MKKCQRKKDDFGSGWSQEVTTDDGRNLHVLLKRGRCLGKFYGNRGYRWSGIVYEQGKQIWSGPVYKDIGLKTLINLATEA